MSVHNSDKSYKIYLDLSDTISYYIEEKNSNKKITKNEIDSKTTPFSEVQAVAGRSIQSAAEFEGIAGKNFFAWMDGSVKDTKTLKVPYFTSRVVGFLKDLSNAYQIKSIKVQFSGKNIEHLSIPLLSQAGIKFTIDPNLKFQLFNGPLGGAFNRDFFEALNSNQVTTVDETKIKSYHDCQNWLQIKKNYEAFCNALEKTDKNAQPNIPHKIHFICVKPSGVVGKPLPDGHQKVVESWKKHHPGWKVKVWNDADLEPLINQVAKEFPKVKETWDKAENATERADIGTLVILWLQGGIYLNTDLPCFGHIGDLHLATDFYVSMESNDLPFQFSPANGNFYIGNAQVASRPGHPMIKTLLQNLTPKEPKHGSWDIFWRTGPSLYTLKINEALKAQREQGKEGVLVLPPTYFYAMHPKFKGGSKEVVESKCLPWTKGIHLFDGNW